MAGYSTPAWVNGSSPAINAAALTAMGQAIELSEHPYGTCTTAAATAAKTVTIDFSGTLSLFTGLSIRVKFNNTNTAASPTLNVNGTGAKSIVSPGYTGTITWSANQVIDFTYNGSQWVFFSPDTYTKTQSLSNATATLINTKFGSTPSTPDAALNILATALPATATNAKFNTGSYNGTGTYGAINPCSINCGFPPKFVYIASDIVTQAGTWAFWMQGLTKIKAYNTAQSFMNFSVTDNTLSWYCTYSAQDQLNVSGTRYYWFAIGG